LFYDTRRKTETPPDLATFDLNPKKVVSEMKRVLKKFKMEKIVTFNQIKSLISSTKFDELWIVNSVLVGLLPQKYCDIKYMEELVSAINNLHNITPRKELKNKSPQEVANENPNRKPQWESSANKIGSNEWFKYDQKAHQSMLNSDYKRAIKNYKKMFEQLLNDKTTFRELYRLYANYAVACFSSGDLATGAAMLDISLGLNSNYDFGLKLKKRDEYRAGNYINKKGVKIDDNDPAITYYTFISKFKINFKTEKLTKSKLITYRGE
jgi:tetratricopeptide (TPR) repeat protein